MTARTASGPLLTDKIVGVETFRQEGKSKAVAGLEGRQGRFQRAMGGLDAGDYRHRSKGWARVPCAR